MASGDTRSGTDAKGIDVNRHLLQSSSTIAAAEQYKELMRTLLERGGRFQLILIMLISLNSIIIGINHTITTFHVYVPEFFCKDSVNQSCYSAPNASSCPSGYSFDTEDDFSVAVEFETVCDRAMLAPLLNTLYFVGVSLGSLVCSSLCDIYGRRKLVLLCLYAQALTAIGQYYAGSFVTFVALRLAQGFFIQGLQTCSYTLAMEFCPARYRTKAAIYWESNWAVGLGFLGAAAYFVRNWRLLTLAVTAPAFVSVTYIWLFPESLVWLEVQQRRTEAFALMKRIANFNRDYDLVAQCNSLQLVDSKHAEDSHKDESSPNKVTNEKERVGIATMLRNAVLRKHLLSMVCVWFSVTLSYYGVLFYLPNLAGQRHVNFEIGASIELFAYILAYFVLSRFGRRIPMAFYQYSNGCMLFLIGMLSQFPQSGFVRGSKIVIALIAKGLSVSSFGGMFIYSSELFPTVVRGLGLGICGCSARVGSLLAPQLLSLINFLPDYVPLSIISLLLLVAATVTLLLPETLTTILPNTIAEADLIWG